MTTYTDIPNGDVDSDSPITTSLITKLRDNPIAITEGSSGAPQVQTAGIANDAVTAAKLASNAVVNASVASGAAIATSKLANDGGITQGKMAIDSVGQNQIRTANQIISSFPTSDGGQFIATGGIYVIGHTMDGGFVSGESNLLSRKAQNGTLLSLWSWEGGSAAPNDCRLYYINGSPPYDLGDGEIPLFLYARIANGTGEVQSINSAIDPIWAYNGPTDWASKRKGNKLELKDMSLVRHTFEEAKALGGAAIQEYMQALREAPMIEVDLTQEIKNADMNLIPSPWDDIPGATIVMLDPQSTLVRDLSEMHEAGEKYSDIIRNYIEIDNTPVDRRGPPALMQVGCRWKTNL